MKKKLAAIAMATAMAASLAACSSKPAETTAAAEENEETTAEAAEGSEAAEAGDSAFAGKTLVMSTNAEFAPYEYHDGNDIVGIDVDIANALRGYGSISGNHRRSIRFYHPGGSVWQS